MGNCCFGCLRGEAWCLYGFDRWQGECNKQTASLPEGTRWFMALQPGSPSSSVLLAGPGHLSLTESPPEAFPKLQSIQWVTSPGSQEQVKGSTLRKRQPPRREHRTYLGVCSMSQQRICWHLHLWVFFPQWTSLSVLYILFELGLNLCPLGGTAAQYPGFQANYSKI